ncbi:MAG: Holliday junction resolvase RecU [Bacilli bacterium]
MRYPVGSKNDFNNEVSYSNRGMTLEKEINISNEYYLLNDIAIIHKKPTPITVNKVDYNSRFDATIKEAHFKIPSTTDYNGIYKGKYIDFEAKETKNIKLFPLSNIHKHQLEHLKKIVRHGGIGFIIIRFIKINQTFLITIDKVLEYINDNYKKSIPVDYIEKFGYSIKDKYNPRIDYLEILDKIYFKGDTYEKENK